MTMTTRDKEWVLLQALSVSNRADFSAHYPAKEQSMENLVEFFMLFNGGREAINENQD